MSAKAWIKDIKWNYVVSQNATLCKARTAHHGPTSEGYSLTRDFWESNFRTEFEIPELLQFLKSCHRMAPFTNYNGNTFAAIGRIIVERAGFLDSELKSVRSLAGHIVAGVAGDEEVEALRILCEVRFP